MELLIAVNITHHQKAAAMACVFDSQWKTRPALEAVRASVMCGIRRRQKTKGCYVVSIYE